MMRRSTRYKHVNCVDLVVECLRCVPVPRGFKVKLKYLILSADRRSLIDPKESPEEVLITHDQISNWKVWFPKETHEST